jgi:hypothetical protein
MPILGIMSSAATGSAGNFDSIATTTLTTGATHIEFGSIPSGYKHLQVRGIIMNSVTQDNVSIRVGNGSVDTAANYSSHQLQGNGATIVSNSSVTATSMGLSGLATNSSLYPFVFVYDILDYSSTSKNKTVKGISGQDGNGTGTATNWRVQLSSGSWRSTSAINTVRIYTPAGNIGNLSTIALYGIK